MLATADVPVPAPEPAATVSQASSVSSRYANTAIADKRIIAWFGRINVGGS
jgi:hypothetical protein